MIVYYNRTTGETTDAYSLAKKWHKLGQRVFTYNYLINKIYDWKTNKNEKM